MSAEWVTVPDGKKEHIGVLIGNYWTPICGQQGNWLGAGWFPVRLTLSLRRKKGKCSDCLKVRDAINALGDGSAG